MEGLSYLFPEIFLTLMASLLLIGDAFWPLRRRLWLQVSCISVLASMIYLACMVTNLSTPAPIILNMAVLDGFARYFKFIILLGLLLVLWMSESYRDFEDTLGTESEPGTGSVAGWGTYFALLIFATVGLLLLSSATDFILVFVAIELLGISTFILAGFLKHERRSTEAAIKFFLIGAFSSGLLIYGVSILYGLLGTTQIQAFVQVDFSTAPRLPYVGAAIFILAGFGFKMAMAPFHMWVPDTYEGAPTPVTAFISVAPKAGAVAILVRSLSNHAALGLSNVLAILAFITMSVGNLAALSQTNLKRLLGYSSIAQMGYVLIGFVAGGTEGTSAALVYILSYLIMNLGAFACVIAVTNEAGTDEMDALNGLSTRSLPLALATTVFMISLTGLPPLIGFVGKFSIFAGAIAKGWTWLAVGGVLNSVVSLYYYFGFIHRMFFRKALSQEKPSLSPYLISCVGVTLFITIFAGVFPQKILTWVRQVVP